MSFRNESEKPHGNFKHGKSTFGRRTPMYKLWASMKDRCQRIDSYRNFGIRVCEEWSDFNAFEKYVEENLGPKPKGLSLDRIDNSKGYEPGNVRWATARIQANNRRSCTNLTLKGETHTVAEWAEKSGTPYATILRRLQIGWSEEDAVFKPMQKEGPLTAKGETMSARQWSKRSGVPAATINARKRDGWPDEAAIFKPVQKPMLALDGETLSVAEWSKRTGLSQAIIHNRKWLGWTDEETLKTPPRQLGIKKSET